MLNTYSGLGQQQAAFAMQGGGSVVLIGVRTNPLYATILECCCLYASPPGRILPFVDMIFPP